MGIRSLLRNAFGRSKATREEAGAAPSSAGTPESATIPEAREESAPVASPKSPASPKPSEAEVPAARTAPTEHPTSEPAPTPTTATLPAQGSPVDRAAKPARENEEEPKAQDDDKPEALAPEADTSAPDTGVSDLVSQAFDNPAPATTPEPTTSHEEPDEAPQPATPEAEAPAEPAAKTDTEAVTPAPQPEPEPVQDATPEPVQDATPEPAVETPAPETGTEAAPKAEAAATETEPATEVEPAPKAEDAPKEAAPKAEPETAQEPEATPEPKAETAAKAEATPAVEATPEPQATTDATATVTAPATPAPKKDGVPAGLLPLHTAAGATLEKHGLSTQRAVVYLVLDRSGSMRNYYKDGTVQNLAEQALALSAHFDDEPTVPVVFFSTDIDGTADLDLSNYEGRIEELHAGLGHMGRTNYHWAVNAVVEHYKKSGTTAPAFVIFQTDGAPTSKPAAEKALCEAAKLPIFWQFIGFGDPEAKGFDFLRKLDDLTVPEKRAVDNAGFFHAGRDPRSLSHDELYQQLMVEFPEWLPGPPAPRSPTHTSPTTPAPPPPGAGPPPGPRPRG
ncbi:VWA domain-containing protein [Streptomyces sp. NPDC059649]|uniref:VWA domain-containing protein n=1 Tax=Streptomyces sp. NPDC059649 TaxID=3346895 RepID=UPI0036A5891F